MYLHVSFEDGAEKEIPVSTAHVLEIKDNTLGTVDSFAFDGVTSVTLVQGEQDEAPDDEYAGDDSWPVETASTAVDIQPPSPLAGD